MQLATLQNNTSGFSPLLSIHSSSIHPLLGLRHFHTIKISFFTLQSSQNYNFLSLPCDHCDLNTIHRIPISEILPRGILRPPRTLPNPPKQQHVVRQEEIKAS